MGLTWRKNSAQSPSSSVVEGAWRVDAYIRNPVTAATAARSVVQEGHKHVFGAVVPQGIHPQPVDRAAVRALYATAGRANVASDVGVGQQPQDRRYLSVVKVGQLCPSAGPHTVVDAARRQPEHDAAPGGVGERA